MTDKHTPGPWEWVPYCNVYREEDWQPYIDGDDEIYPPSTGTLVHFYNMETRKHAVVCDDGGAGGEYKAVIDINGPDARLIAAAPDLLAALEGMQQFFAMPDEGSIDRFDRLAGQYRRETGNWAPGKSIPDAYNDSTDPETRRAQYDAWVQGKVDAARAAIAKARGQV